MVSEIAQIERASSADVAAAPQKNQQVRKSVRPTTVNLMLLPVEGGTLKLYDRPLGNGSTVNYVA